MTKTEALEAKISHKPVYFGDDMVLVLDVETDPIEGNLAQVMMGTKVFWIHLEWLEWSSANLW